MSAPEQNKIEKVDLKTVTLDGLQAIDGNRVDEDHQTLSPRRLRQFIDRPNSGIKTIDDLKANFSLDTAIALTDMEKSDAGKTINNVFKSAKNVLQNANQLNLMKIDNEPEFDSQLKDAINNSPHGALLGANQKMLLEAHHLLLLIRVHAEDSIRTTDISRLGREAQKPVSFFQEAKNFLKDAGKTVATEWKTWPTELKIGFAGVTAFLIYEFATAKEDSFMGKVKEFAWTVTKIGAAGVGLGIGAEGIGRLTTRESLFNSLWEGTKPTLSNPGKWKERFGTDFEKVAQLSIILKDKPFKKVLEEYKSAKNSGKRKIDTLVPSSEMSGEDVMAGLDGFFMDQTKNPPEDKTAVLLNKYGGWKNPPTYGEVFAFEWPKEDFVLKGNIGERVAGGTKELFGRAYSFFNSTDTVAAIKSFYKKHFGDEPDEKTLNAFKTKFGHCIDKADELPATIDGKIAPNKNIAEALKKALVGAKDAQNDVNYFENSDGYTYIVAKRNINGYLQNEKMLAEGISAIDRQTTNFAVTQYGLGQSAAEKGMEVYGSVYVVGEDFHYFVRIKTPATKTTSGANPAKGAQG